MSLTLYGIPNCDSCRAARKWLDAQGHRYTFHDVRADGLKKGQVAGWLQRDADLPLVNRRSRTWKELDAATRAQADAGAAAVAGLLAAHPLLLKRPLLESPTVLACGFKAPDWLRLLGEASD